MKITVLSKERTQTAAFPVSGDCYICAKGHGQVRILREMGGVFEVVTDENGDPLVYTSNDDGVIFNSFIHCSGRLNHMVEAVTTDKITVSVAQGK